MNENFNAANKSKALDVFFALCEKAKINEHSRWERDMPKLRKLDKNAFECFATMPERRSAFNKYKVKLSSNAAEKAVGTTKTTTKESKLEREKIAREKREREILEKKRDDEYRLKKLKRNQDKGDAMKQFETLLAESIKSIDDVETIDDVRELLSQDPLGRAFRADLFRKQTWSPPSMRSCWSSNQILCNDTRSCAEKQFPRCRNP